MTSFSLRSVPGSSEAAAFSAAARSHAFLIPNLFQPGQVQLVSTNLDRAIVGGVVPLHEPLSLLAPEELRVEYFLQRRELGIINLGETGAVQVDGVSFDLGTRECLYVGKSVREILFFSENHLAPASFYLVSYPAHAEFPTVKAATADANRIILGSKETANDRTIYQYIHEKGIRSCQLVMGFTELASGSVWNTMPPHTHARRSEIYCYFDIPPKQRVLHMMGEPQETRPLWVGDRGVVLSPEWSIHCGVGTTNYRFVWAMGGENQRFDDMDPASLESLR